MMTTTQPLRDRQTCAKAPEPTGGLTPPRSDEVEEGAGMGPRDAEFHAFPVECFPGPVREYVQSQARDLDCDEAAVALPVLAALASSIGSTRRIRLKRGKSEPARGLLVCSEQLDGWLKRSSPTRGAELANWLDLYDGQSLTVERRTALPIHLPLASISLTGTVSPEVLSQKLTKAKTPCELLSRLLLASPPPRPRRWTDDEVEGSVMEEYSAVIEKLGALTIENQESGDGGQESESGVKPKKKRRKPPMDLTPPRKLDTGSLIVLLDKAEKRYGPTVREMISQQTYDALEPGSSIGDDAVLEEFPTPVTVELSPEAKRLFGQFVNEFGQDQSDTALSGGW